MKIFLYEFCVVHFPEYLARDSSLYREGLAMLMAVRADIGALKNCQITEADATLKEPRNRDELEFDDDSWIEQNRDEIEFANMRKDAEDCDYSLFIAPESTDGYKGYLEASASCTSLNCRLDAIELTSDKYAIYRHWHHNQVRTPLTLLADDPQEHFPLSSKWRVYKPRYGAGSEGILKFSNESWYSEFASLKQQLLGTPYVMQPLIAGRAASISFLVGKHQSIPLRATFQHIDSENQFRYEGGCLSLHPTLEERAVSLGQRSIQCIDGLNGYVGVDLILGNAADGSEDYAIEINPRLTTSYVGLRVLADFNLAQAMIDVVEGRPVDYIKWKPGRVRFWPDGRTEYDPTPGAVFE